MQLPLEKQDLLNNELNSKESILWSGEPNPARHAKMGLPTMLVGIPFTAFSIFWIYNLANIESTDFSIRNFDTFLVFQLLFMFVGLSIVFTPLGKYLQARKTIYAVTNKRAIIVEGFFNTSVRSFRRSELDDIERTTKSDGSGDLIFVTEYTGSGRNRRVKKIGFIGIPEVKKVERLLQKI